MLARVISTTKDRNATSTVVTKTIGTMGIGVLQTSRPVQMPRPTQHLRFRMFLALELAKLLVPVVCIFIV